MMGACQPPVAVPKRSLLGWRVGGCFVECMRRLRSAGRVTPSARQHLRHLPGAPMLPMGFCMFTQAWLSLWIEQQGWPPIRITHVHTRARTRTHTHTHTQTNTRAHTLNCTHAFGPRREPHHHHDPHPLHQLHDHHLHLQGAAPPACCPVALVSLAHAPVSSAPSLAHALAPALSPAHALLAPHPMSMSKVCSDSEARVGTRHVESTQPAHARLMQPPLS